MTQDEAIELLQLIDATYNQISFNKEKARLWIGLMLKGDYAKSKRMLEEFMFRSKFPPTISDFVVLSEINHFDIQREQMLRDKQQIEKEENDPTLRKKREEAKRKLEKAMQDLRKRKIGDDI